MTNNQQLLVCLNGVFLLTKLKNWEMLLASTGRANQEKQTFVFCQNTSLSQCISVCYVMQ